ncbi:MAG TPA: hypothetical protein VFQ61_07785 [Polyangiaceae bacterium]|nr:hypothetical protein [Polyangiaceae bacterium]
MNFIRVAVVALSTSVSTLLACSASDTVISVNVRANENVGAVERLTLTISQDGQSPVTRTLDDSTKLNTRTGKIFNYQTGVVEQIPNPETDPEKLKEKPTIDKTGPVLKTDFFERFILPDGWKEGKATITGKVALVEAQADGSKELDTKMPVEVSVIEEAAVAAYIDFERHFPEATGGTTGTGGATATGGSTGETGGTTGTGGSTATGGTTSDAGAGGAGS